MSTWTFSKFYSKPPSCKLNIICCYHAESVRLYYVIYQLDYVNRLYVPVSTAFAVNQVSRGRFVY